MKTHSPCIRICSLDAQNICLGCGRTLSEIGQWRSWSDEQKNAWWVGRENKNQQAQTASSTPAILILSPLTPQPFDETGGSSK